MGSGYAIHYRLVGEDRWYVKSGPHPFGEAARKVEQYASIEPDCEFEVVGL